MVRLILLIQLLAWSPAVVVAAVVDGAQRPQAYAPVPLDVDDETSEEQESEDERGQFLVVPIPFSNPTLGSGLVLGAGYFHPQTAAQKAAQPPSVTGAGAMYSANGSYGGAVGNASYWAEDTWRFVGLLGYADLDLPLLAPEATAGILDIDWLIEATVGYGEISRRLGGDWYLGTSLRWVDVEQAFDFQIADVDLVLDNAFDTAGAGLSLTWDTRDVPSNAYEGRYFRANAFYNADSLGSDYIYESYGLNLKSYHLLRERLVLAWRLTGCAKRGDVPLWDACRVPLRGFASTDYLGRSSVIGEFEARWRFAERWGVVGFAGGGRITESLTGNRDGDLIPSYGVGLRFMVQPENRVNMRLDYGRSRDDTAIYFSVGEAF